MSVFPTWGDRPVDESTEAEVPPPRSVDVIEAEIAAIKAEISEKQKSQSELFRELKAVKASLSRDPPPVAAITDAPAADLTDASAPAAALSPAPTFTLVIPESKPVKHTMLYLIGRDGVKSPSQAEWSTSWRSALKHVQGFPKEAQPVEFAKMKQLFEDKGCRFETRPVVPRGDGPARGGRGGPRS